MLRRLLIASVALLLFLPGAAAAHPKTISDGNDVAGPLDIKSFSVGHTSDQVRFAIKTYQEWSKQAVAGSNGTIYVIIELPGDGSYLIVVKTDSSSGDLKALLLKCAPSCNTANGTFFDTDKPNPRTVTFWIPRSKLAKVGQQLKVVAQTGSGSGCDGFCNDDFAPNSGYAKHDIGPAG